MIKWLVCVCIIVWAGLCSASSGSTQMVETERGWLLNKKYWRGQRYYVLTLNKDCYPKLRAANRALPLKRSLWQRVGQRLGLRRKGTLMRPEDSLGINAGFFHADGSPSGLLKIDKAWVRQTRSKVPRAVVGWKRIKNGNIEWFFDRQQRGRWEMSPVSDFYSEPWWEDADFIVQGGGLLLKDGVAMDFSTERLHPSFVFKRNARTLLCQTFEGTIKWIVVQGGDRFMRSLGLFKKRGVTLEEAKQLAIEESCEHAINLDGGYSSQMVVGSWRINGIPSWFIPPRAVVSAIVYGV